MNHTTHRKIRRRKNLDYSKEFLDGSTETLFGSSYKIEIRPDGGVYLFDGVAYKHEYIFPDGRHVYLNIKTWEWEDKS